MRKKVEICNFSYFCAIAAPQATRKRFRTLCDWGNWVFPYDDMFDNGGLRDQPEAARAIMNDLMAPMMGHTYDRRNRHAIIRAHDSVVHRIKTKPDAQRRFALAMAKYCRGALIQVDDSFTGRIPSLEEMVLTRRESAGVSPLYHLVEYAHDLHVPNDAFEDPIIAEMEVLGMDLVSISNDILSYRKEEREGVTHNMVAICRLNGLSAQAAFDEVGRLLTRRYERWNDIESMFLGSKYANNRSVVRYVEGIKSVVQANISWSFKSQRYLGRQAEQVRITRKIEVESNPSFLERKQE
jgi:hypothetical protein